MIVTETKKQTEQKTPSIADVLDSIIANSLDIAAIVNQSGETDKDKTLARLLGTDRRLLQERYEIAR